MIFAQSSVGIRSKISYAGGPSLHRDILTTIILPSTSQATSKTMEPSRIFRELPRITPLRLLIVRSNPLPPQRRQLHTTSVWSTDGVYKALNAMRVKTPWIEALRKQKQHCIDPARNSDTPATPLDLDLRPKKMSDSYHRVVRNFNSTILHLTD